MRQQLRQLQHYTGQLAKDTTSQLKLLTEQQPYGDTGAKIQVIFLCMILIMAKERLLIDLLKLHIINYEI